MGQLRDRSQFYYTLATMLNAGVAIVSALRQPFQGVFQAASNNMYFLIDHGTGITDAMSQQKVFSPFELAIISVGEQSGQLPESFKALAEWFELKHRMRQKIIIGMIYPFIIYNLAGPILGVINVATDQSTIPAAILKLFLWILLPWLVLLLFCILKPIFRKNAFCGSLVDAMPILGKLQFKLETANFFKSLGMSLNAGMGAKQSVTLAAESCTNASYLNRYAKIAQIIDTTGCGFAEAFYNVMTKREADSAIPALLATGEQSGQMPEFCNRIAALHMEEAANQMGLLSKILPFAIYLMLIAYLVFKVLSFYSDYIGQINNLLL